MSDFVLNVSGLGKCYATYRNNLARFANWFGFPARHTHEYWALKDVNFALRRGEALAIIGQNGAGKSTLLKLITGTVRPTTGSIQINGRISAILELGLGFNPDFTGRQNVYLAGGLMGLSIAELTALIPGVEEFAEIGEFFEQPLRVYSSGMQARLAFAVATAVRPDVLIVDEVLSVGDSYFQHKSFSRIRLFKEQGTTLLLVSHDLAAVRALCPRCAWLDNGTLREIGETKAVLDAYTTALYAKEQDVDNAAKQSIEKHDLTKHAPKQKRDCRLDFINNSNLRNDVEVFEFNKDAPRWGDGLAKITNTYLQDTNGVPLGWLIGGEEVVLTIEALALEDLRSVIVGFQVRDRLGQNLFGDNTYITTIDTLVSARANSTLKTTFHFMMPILPQGIYAVTAAIATGTQRDHVIHDWVNESLFFESHNGFSASGLVGVPMHDIEIEEFNGTCS